MPPIPREKGVDSALALFRDPYGFLTSAARRHRSDVFQTRLMGRRTICLTGAAAAEVFYDTSKFKRAGAAPRRLQKTLFGKGGVQGLDDEAHRHRKAPFLSLMTADRMRQLTAITADWWHRYAVRWSAVDQDVVLYEQLQELLIQAVCAWAGVPLSEDEARQRSREIAALFDAAGTVGPRHWRSRQARKSADRWIEGLIGEIRAGHCHPSQDSAAYAMAWHRDLHGDLLTTHVAAVDLLNVIRPSVAVAVYLTFAAHALGEHQECRDKSATGDDGYWDLFAQEVRRFYPFFPVVMAVAREDFEWNGYQFPRGRRTVLDLYGTNHDPRTWGAPEQFSPERFRTWDGDLFTFIPHGGGDYDTGHRCPGEWIATELIKVSTDFLTAKIDYHLPPQDLSIDQSRLPALPRSRVVIRNVTLRPASGASSRG